MSFLKATWSYLPFANFPVNPQLLHPYLPNGTVLDLYDGKAYLSLVGLRFEKTRVLGIPVPGHINFSEINLRFYVKNPSSGRHGVVFIKEIVDKPMITWVANNLYHERYQTMPIDFELAKSPKEQIVTYRWKPKQWQKFEVSYDPKPLQIANGSKQAFILERYFGYSSRDKATTYEYEVKHATWEHFEVKSHSLQVDFEETYGAEFAFLNNIQPDSIYMARGSRIAIDNKRKMSYDSDE